MLTSIGIHHCMHTGTADRGKVEGLHTRATELPRFRPPACDRHGRGAEKTMCAWTCVPRCHDVAAGTQACPTTRCLYLQLIVLVVRCRTSTFGGWPAQTRHCSDIPAAPTCRCCPPPPLPSSSLYTVSGCRQYENLPRGWCSCWRDKSGRPHHDTLPGVPKKKVPSLNR